MAKVWTFEQLEQWLDRLPMHWEFLGNTAQRWAAAVAIFVLAGLAVNLLKRVLRRRSEWLAEKTGSDWFRTAGDFVQATRSWFRLVVSLYAGSLVLDLPEKSETVVQSVAVVVLLLQVAVWGNVLLLSFIKRYVERRMEHDAASVTTISALGFVGRLVLWSIVVLLALENVGVDVTALVAGLGVGGIAVALAAQNILGDLFASLSIVLDKPFVLGDFIIVGDCLGTVENIGLKTTRVRSLSGEQLVFSNNDLLGSRIRNYKRMQERRIVFPIGVTYETAFEKLTTIPQMLRAAVEAQEPTRFDRAHFKSYGDFALIFEVVYYLLVPDYNVYMDVQQAINLRIFQEFEQAGIEFAYPTQTLHVAMLGRTESGKAGE